MALAQGQQAVAPEAAVGFKPAGAARPWEASLPISPYSSINLATGEMTTSIPFASWRVAGPGVGFSLYHNSMATTAFTTLAQQTNPSYGWNPGDGWSFSYSSWLKIYSNHVFVIEDDGRQVCFIDVNGQLVGPPGDFRTLVLDNSDPDPNNHVYVLTAKDQTRRVYNASDGRLLRVEDASLLDEPAVAGLDLNVHPWRIGAMFEGCLDQYGNDGWICSVRDAAVFNREMMFEYKVAAPYPNTWAFHLHRPDDRSWEIVRESPANGKLLSIIEPTTPQTPPTVTYYAFTYNAWSQIATLTDAEAHTWTFEYDAFGRLTRVVDPLNTIENTQTELNIAYQPLSSPTRMRVTVTDRRGKIWKYIFDDLGRIIKIRNPLLKSRLFAYDSDWNLTQVTNELGKIWNATYDATANLLSLTDPPGHKWAWTYDQYNNVRTISPPLDNLGNLDTTKKVEFRYEDEYAPGVLADPTHLTSIIEPADGQGNPAATTTLTYHHAKLQATAFGPAPGELWTVTDAGGARTEFTYKGAASWNELFRSEGPVGGQYNVEETFRFDTVGRVTETYGYNGGSTTARYTLGTGVTEPSEDTTCQPVEASGIQGTGPRNGVNVTPIPHLPFPDSVCDYIPMPTCDPNFVGPGLTDCPTSTFDLVGNLESRSLTIGSINHFDCHNSPFTAYETETLNHTWTYDELYRPRSHTLAMSLPTQATIVGEPNCPGEPTTLPTQPVITRKFQFDPDANGNLIRLTDSDGLVTDYVYDDANRLTRVDVGGATVVTYTLYDTGLPQYADYANGTRTEWIYDDALRLDKIRHTAPAGALLLELDYQWMPDGLVDKIIESDGAGSATVDYTYDNRGRLIAETGGTRVPPATFDLAYAYDQLGNRRTKTDNAAVPKITTRYHYDVDPNQASAGYGTFNNRLMWSETKQAAATLEKTWYAYNYGGQPVKIITNSPGGATPNRYFTKCLQYNIDQQLWLYRMVEVDLDPNGTVQAKRVTRAREFRYDLTDRRRYLERDRDPNTLMPLAETWHDYIGNNIYQDLAINIVDPNHPVAAPTARYDWGYNLAAIDDIAGRRFVHFDMLGTTRMQTDDPGGAIASAASYTAFGEVAATIGTNATRYGYVGSWGYQNDGLANPSNDIGMLHVGARYYDPAVGRFVQRDPISIFSGVNIYAYALNTPTLLIDPSGHYSFVQVSTSLGILSSFISIVSGNFGGPRALTVASAAVGVVLLSSAGPGALQLGAKGAKAAGEVAYWLICMSAHP